MKRVMNQCLFPAKVGAGRFALEHLPFDLSGYGASRPLVVVTEEADRAEVLKPLEKAFRGSGLSMGIYTMDGGATPDAVKEAWGHFSEGGFDSVIAVGGGAVLDLAKCLSVAGGAGPDALRALMKGEERCQGQAPLAWVPTLDLDGREAWPVATMGDNELFSMDLVPCIITIDPRMMVGGTSETLIEAAMGALASALSLFEGDMAGSLSRPYARMVSRQVMAGLLPMLERQDETGLLARLKGAIWSPSREDEMAFVTALALSGALYESYNQSLTAALARVLAQPGRHSQNTLAAVLSPSVLSWVHRKGEVSLSPLLMALDGPEAFCAAPQDQRAELGIMRVRELLNRLWYATETRFPRTLADLGLATDALGTLCDAVCEGLEGWSAQDVEAILMGAGLSLSRMEEPQVVESTEEVV